MERKRLDQAEEIRMKACRMMSPETVQSQSSQSVLSNRTPREVIQRGAEVSDHLYKEASHRRKRHDQRVMAEVADCKKQKFDITRSKSLIAGKI